MIYVRVQKAEPGRSQIFLSQCRQISDSDLIFFDKDNQEALRKESTKKI